MEPMCVSCAEVIEIFGDSDLENGADFAGFSPDDINVHDHNDELTKCRNDSASVAYATATVPTTMISPAIDPRLGQRH